MAANEWQGQQRFPMSPSVPNGKPLRVCHPFAGSAMAARTAAVAAREATGGMAQLGAGDVAALVELLASEQLTTHKVPSLC